MIRLIENFEPAALCLLASLAWAPLVLAFALRLDRGRSLAASETLWVTALCLAVLPTLIAPALSAAGVSLRPAKVVEIVEPAAMPAPAARARVEASTDAPALAQGVAPALTADIVSNAAALIYLYGALLAFGVYLVRGALFARQVQAAEPVDHPGLLSALNVFARRLDLSKSFELRRSDAVSTVCVFGLWRPVILLPRDIDARVSFDDLALMGAHELAHVKRGDAALYTFAAILRIVFWFNPFVKRIAARAELAAEQGADALVLALGADRRRYAACFIEGLKFAAERAQLARFATPSFTPFDRQSRRDRLNAILTGEMQRGRPLKLLVALALVLAAGAAFAQAGFAVTPETKIARREPVIIDNREGKPMRAPFDGVVVAATDAYRGKPSYGKVVVIRHEDGRSTLFARLKSYSVKKGDEVQRGDEIGIAGKDPIVTIDTGRKTAAAPLAPSAPVVAAPLPEPAEAPEPPDAPAPTLPAQSSDAPSDALDAELEGRADPEAPPAQYSFVSPPGAAYIFESGEDGSRLAFMKPDGTMVGANGRELSAEEKKRFEKKFRELKKSMEETREKRGEAWNWVGRLDMAALDRIRERASIDARALAERLTREHTLSKRERERIATEAERAIRDAQRDFEKSRDSFSDGWSSSYSYDSECDAACREEARREADEAREEAIAEAQAEREEALAEAQAAREEALAEAEEARQEAEEARQEADEQRRQIEEEIRERAEALAEAERDLAEERADLERLRAELAAKRNDPGF